MKYCMKLLLTNSILTKEIWVHGTWYDKSNDVAVKFMTRSSEFPDRPIEPWEKPLGYKKG